MKRLAVFIALLSVAWITPTYPWVTPKAPATKLANNGGWLVNCPVCLLQFSTQATLQGPFGGWEIIQRTSILTKTVTNIVTIYTVDQACPRCASVVVSVWTYKRQITPSDHIGQ